MELRTAADATVEPGPEEIQTIRLDIRRMFAEMERMDTRIEENMRRFDRAQAETRANLNRIREMMFKDVA